MVLYLNGLAFGAQSGSGPWGIDSPWGMHMMWGTFGIGMMLFMLVFWVLVILGIVVLIRWAWTSMGQAAQKGESAETALNILEKRYARGEIYKEEFEAKRRDLLVEAK